MEKIIKNIFETVGMAIGLIFGFIAIIQIGLLIVGPDYEKGEYAMAYKVYYSDTPRVYTIYNEYPISVRSYRGTNSVEKTVKIPFFKNAYKSEGVLETSAPIEIVSYTFKKSKKI